MTDDAGFQNAAEWAIDLSELDFGFGTADEVDLNDPEHPTPEITAVDLTHLLRRSTEEEVQTGVRVEQISVLMQRYSDGRRFTVRTRASARGPYSLDGWKAEVFVYDENDLLVDQSSSRYLTLRADPGVADLLLEWGTNHQLEPKRFEIRFRPKLLWEGPVPEGLPLSDKYPAASARDLSRVESRPAKLTGESFSMFVRVMQYNSATGQRRFLGEAAANFGRHVSDYDRLAAFTVRTSDILEDVTAGDVMHVRAVVKGVDQYLNMDHEISSVPHYEIRKMALIDFID